MAESGGLACVGGAAAFTGARRETDATASPMHLPWDALAMKAMLERLPLIGGPRNAA
ncbi:hypothetical protein G7939_21440 (plasmid) [Ralstonia solanacearum]|uniref:hypothetical protein n=1 Tax=Ralstonia pseudosolanacearum TaxID=1310165 RepID=UPI0013747801|nr:hypothetical protein [Ralstonia pseudosolanacearum]MCK4119427.1 hypothetical protein [Ralstonia pseudosolanacearum]QIK25334.1 hypothetical protein G7939_21440 [Ralstonia solanacearum]QIK30238.1 hypothetical protein G7947_20530 [Ralstonia solanacearum]QIK35146.1 hypothetical protein G7969_24675 [Ralstonia solanacearum]